MKSIATSFRDRICAFLKEEDGPTAVEYAVMLALIIMTAVATIGAMGGALTGKYTYIDTEIQNHTH